MKYSLLGWVALGGAIGAVARALTATWVQEKAHISFPLGTLTVNVLGSFIIGFFIIYFLEHLMLPQWVRLLVVVGFLGAFTTFSSFSYETIALINSGAYTKALVYILTTNLLCFGATIFGVYLGRSLALL
jgi:CrcB protein